MNGIDTSRVFIIAEAGVNHNSDPIFTYRLVDAAKKAGADAVKFQTFIAERVVMKSAEKADYQKKVTGTSESQLEMMENLALPFDFFDRIKEDCDEKGIIFLSTPFDYDSVDFIEGLVPLYKVGSGDITNLQFLKYISKKGKPIFLSTGMSSLGEVEEAVDAIMGVNAGCALVLLHCTSSYPTDFRDANLKAMLTLKEAFGFPVGYSDHTLGIEVPIAAVALGAQVIEKHFTLDRNLSGPDHKASLEPQELKQMVRAIRTVEKALGNGIKRPTQSEFETMKAIRKSLVTTRNVGGGKIVEESDITIKRPGTGIPPKFKETVIGMRLMRGIGEDELFHWEDFK